MLTTTLATLLNHTRAEVILLVVVPMLGCCNCLSGRQSLALDSSNTVSSPLEVDLSGNFSLELTQVTSGDVLGNTNELFKLLGDFSFNLQLLHVGSFISDWILAEEVTDQDLLDVALLALES